ncbi:hypothetical protein PLUA15_510096 [Pseudomonas lundensis]|uniref:Uncharacterized protein n=1 Tax=Pseudomonas lundensis TaxID=86185 RepID=A0AAX2HDS5_9PSED|nr:hypothetical protein PLUA15_510096 [Pseudomonas lundensis]
MHGGFCAELPGNAVPGVPRGENPAGSRIALLLIPRMCAQAAGLMIDGMQPAPVPTATAPL